MLRLSISPDTVREVLVRMRETLAGDDTLAKRALLGKLIVGLEIGRGQAKVKYAFPLACAGLHTVPPG